MASGEINFLEGEEGGRFPDANTWDPPEMFDFFEGMMVGKHLERLELLGLVVCRGGRWVRL